jgi:hypothetical protein
MIFYTCIVLAQLRLTGLYMLFCLSANRASGGSGSEKTQPMRCTGEGTDGCGTVSRERRTGFSSRPVFPR